MQKGYEWLLKETGPNMLREAIKLYGVAEVVGKNHNPIIMGWAKETGLSKIYTNDEIAWCGLFQAIVAVRAGWGIPKSPLWARDWLNWGQHVPRERAMLGDVLVFERGSGGHVGQYVGEDNTHFHVFGGNQSNAVNIMRVEKKRLLGVRSAPWKIAQPPNVRKILLAPGGVPVSTNEA